MGLEPVGSFETEIEVNGQQYGPYEQTDDRRYSVDVSVDESQTANPVISIDKEAYKDGDFDDNTRVDYLTGVNLPAYNGTVRINQTSALFGGTIDYSFDGREGDISGEGYTQFNVSGKGEVRFWVDATSGISGWEVDVDLELDPSSDPTLEVDRVLSDTV